jgi:hypothetical protein
MRSFTLLRHTIHYWKLTLYEDGEPVGGAVGTLQDFDFLTDVGLEFCETV